MPVIFPKLEEIPEMFLSNIPIRQETYLVDGELRRWDGPLQEVFSPVWVRTGEENVPLMIGKAPFLSPAEALEALEAAKRAYANGRGIWPTMSVTERIRCLRQFTDAMEQRRAEIVRLLMLEIGKSRREAEAEFDGPGLHPLHGGRPHELDRASRGSKSSSGTRPEPPAPLGVELCMGPSTSPSTRPSDPGAGPVM